jgi:hypothetical protein
MKRQRWFDDVVIRFCNFLGRQTAASGALDWVASWFLPRVRWGAGVLPAGGATGPDIWLAKGPYATPGSNCPTCRDKAPDTPGKPNRDDVQAEDRPGLWSRIVHWWRGTSHQAKKDQADRMAGKGGCDDPKYHGMHGRPCRFAGGSDLKCPPGSKSGWFWSYETPVGRIFYVDCCGGTPKGSVWCNWTSEADWCVSLGQTFGRWMVEGGYDRDAYNCTLAIPDSQMETQDVGGGKFKVVGVDP